MMQLFDLSGRVAVVTGGNAGIGLAIARALGEAGAAVALAGRRADENAAAAAKLARAACARSRSRPMSPRRVPAAR